MPALLLVSFWAVAALARAPIPVTVIIKDCGVDDVRELHWIRICEETRPFAIWPHDFGDEQIGNGAGDVIRLRVEVC